MIFTLLVAFSLVLISLGNAWGQAACTHYASPGVGAGHAGTIGDPFRVRDFWTVGGGPQGKVLCLNDGTYTGADHMIAPSLQAAAGLSGTSSAPITIRALNDGGALIDGQFARGPVSLSGNNWFVLEGFNAKNSSVSGLFLNNSNHNIIRRVVIWDQAFTKNYDLLKLDDSSHNLIEDVGIFGTGRKSLGPPFEGSTDNVFRRVWARWEGSTTIGPKMTGSISYCPAGNCLNNTWENLLLTWSAESMPETYTITNGDGTASTKGSVSGFFVEQAQSVQHPDAAGGACLNAKFLGSLFYVTQNDRYPYNRMSGFPSPTDTRPTCIFLEHVFAFIQPSHPNFANVLGFQGGGSATPPNSNFAKNLTSVAGLANNFMTGWNVDSTVVHGTSLAAVPNPWTTTGNGANLCKRWINGVVTNEPLWPWPMNDRIKAATASAGSYGGPCSVCTGGRAVRTETDVTAQVESLLGPIPTQCRSESGPIAPPSTGGFVEYQLDEAANGTAPATALDSGASPVLDLTHNYASNVAYTAPGTGRGLTYTTALGNGGPAADVDGTKVKTLLQGKQRLQLTAAMDLTSIGDFSRLFAIDVGGTNDRLTILFPTSTSLRMAFNGVIAADWTGLTLTGARKIIQVGIDTTQPTAANRIRLRINKVDQGDADAGTMPSQSATLDLQTGAKLTIGNRSTGSRSPAGIISFVKIQDQALTTAQQDTEHDAIVANDDAPGGGGGAQPPQGIITDSVGAPTAHATVAMLTPQLPTNNPPGNLMIAFVAAINGSTPTWTAQTTVGVPPNQTQENWTQLGTTCHQGNTNLAAFWRRTLASEAAPSVTVSAIGSGHAVVIGSWRNVDTTTPFDGVTPFSGGRTAATLWVPPGVTTATDKAKVVSVVATPDDNAKILSTVQGFTELCSGAACDPATFLGYGIADKEQTPAGVVTMPEWTQAVNGDDEWCGLSFSLRLASQEPNPPPGQGGGTAPIGTPRVIDIPLAQPAAGTSPLVTSPPLVP